MTLEDSCRESGFDPQQLSCDTCELLQQAAAESKQIHEACLECCQSHKTLHGQPQRYEYAVLVYNVGGDEMKSFVEESVEEIRVTKGKGRLELVPILQRRIMPSTLYWFESMPPAVDGSVDAKVMAYQSTAKERVRVEGWRKEDLKDMLLTLLRQD